MNTSKSIFRFIAVGLSTVAIDYAVYSVLLDNGIERSVGKSLSFICGVLYSYLLNKNWTFEFKGSASRSAAKYFLLYGGTLAINVAVNDYTMDLVTSKGVDRHAQSFILATAISAIANFIGMRYYAFKPARR